MKGIDREIVHYWLNDLEKPRKIASKGENVFKSAVTADGAK